MLSMAALIIFILCHLECSCSVSQCVCTPRGCIQADGILTLRPPTSDCSFSLGFPTPTP